MSVKAILYLQEISSNTGKQYLILLLLIMELKYNTNLKYIILKLKYVRWFQNKDLKQTGNTRTGIKIVNLCIVTRDCKSVYCYSRCYKLRVYYKLHRNIKFQKKKKKKNQEK